MIFHIIFTKEKDKRSVAEGNKGFLFEVEISKGTYSRNDLSHRFCAWLGGAFARGIEHKTV